MLCSCPWLSSVGLSGYTKALTTSPYPSASTSPSISSSETIVFSCTSKNYVTLCSSEWALSKSAPKELLAWFTAEAIRYSSYCLIWSVNSWFFFSSSLMKMNLRSNFSLHSSSWSLCFCLVTSINSSRLSFVSYSRFKSLHFLSKLSISSSFFRISAFSLDLSSPTSDSLTSCWFS